MKVRILSTGNVEEYDGSYAQRLVDMGYAVTCQGAFREESHAHRGPAVSRTARESAAEPPSEATLLEEQAPVTEETPEPETEAPKAEEEPKAEEVPKAKTAKSRKK